MKYSYCITILVVVVLVSISVILIKSNYDCLPLLPDTSPPPVGPVQDQDNELGETLTLQHLTNTVSKQDIKIRTISNHIGSLRSEVHELLNTATHKLQSIPTKGEIKQLVTSQLNDAMPPPHRPAHFAWNGSVRHELSHVVPGGTLLFPRDEHTNGTDPQFILAPPPNVLHLTLRGTTRLFVEPGNKVNQTFLFVIHINGNAVRCPAQTLIPSYENRAPAGSRVFPFRLDMACETTRDKAHVYADVHMTEISQRTHTEIPVGYGPVTLAVTCEADPVIYSYLTLTSVRITNST